MVKGVECIHPELQRCPFAQLRVLEQPHIPNVYSGAAKAVASQGWESPHFGLNVAGSRILGNIPRNIGAASGTPNIDQGDVSGAACTHAHQIDAAPEVPDTVGIQDS